MTRRVETLNSDFPSLLNIQSFFHHFCCSNALHVLRIQIIGNCTNLGVLRLHTSFARLIAFYVKEFVIPWSQ